MARRRHPTCRIHSCPSVSSAAAGGRKAALFQISAELAAIQRAPRRSSSGIVNRRYWSLRYPEDVEILVLNPPPRNPQRFGNRQWRCPPVSPFCRSFPCSPAVSPISGLRECSFDSVLKAFRRRILICGWRRSSRTAVSGPNGPDRRQVRVRQARKCRTRGPGRVVVMGVARSCGAAVIWRAFQRRWNIGPGQPFPVAFKRPFCPSGASNCRGVRRCWFVRLVAVFHFYPGALDEQLYKRRKEADGKGEEKTSSTHGIFARAFFR